MLSLTTSASRNVLSLVLVVQVDHEGHEPERDHDDEDKGADDEAPVRSYVLALRDDTD